MQEFLDLGEQYLSFNPLIQVYVFNWAMCKYNNSIYSICFNPLIQVYVFNYKDCEEDIKEDRETGPYVYPSDYTAFDLFIDNIILYAKESDFKDNDFIKLFKELNEVEFTDYKEFAY